MLIRTLGINLSEILNEIHAFSFKKKTFENVFCEMAAILSRIPVDSPAKTVMRKVCLCHDIVIRNQMEAVSALLALCAGNSPVAGEFPSQRSVTRSFDVFFDLHLNKSLSKKLWGWWFEKPSRSLWRHCNVSRQCYKDKRYGRSSVYSMELYLLVTIRRCWLR